MTPETDPAAAANAVRGPGLRDVLTAFPEHRILHARTRGDQVAVTHGGETTIYESPQALAAEIRTRDPWAQEQLRLIEAAVERGRTMGLEIDERHAAADALLASARRLEVRARERIVAALAREAEVRGLQRAFWRSLAGVAALAILVFVVTL